MGKKPFTFEFQYDWERDPIEKQPSRPLKFLMERGAVVEITTRTIHGRLLIRPGTKANDITSGVMGRSLSLFPEVRLFGHWFLSNHYNLLAYFPNAQVMAAFMNHLNGCLGRELGALYDWKEKIFGRRYRAIVLADEESQVRRLAYLLAQGTKEGLVARPDQWPGTNCLRTLLEGTTLQGPWLDKTALYRARRSRPDARAKDFITQYEVRIDPLPCWAALPEEERRARVRTIVSSIEEAAAAENARLRRKPMGAEKILRQHPHDHPAKIAKSPAPMCHAASRASFWRYANAYRAFVKAYREASRALRAGDLGALERFPPGCILPTLGRTPTARAGPTIQAN